MNSDNKVYNIKTYKQKWSFNIGIVIFGVIFIYLIFTILTYLTTKHITAYEVRLGSIVKDNAYAGIALRQEIVFNCESDGYVNYYITEGDKVRTAESVYTISDKPQEDIEISNDSARELTSEELDSILLKIQKFNEHFDNSKFSTLHMLKNDISNSLQNITNQSKIAQLTERLASGQDNSLQLYNTVEDGLIYYYVDGFESYKFEDIKKSSFERESYARTDLYSNQQIKTSQPAYKLVTSENWQLVVELSEDTAKELIDQKYVRINFLKDNEKVWAGLTIKEQDNMFLGCLSFDNSMIRYADERFIDIEIILEDETGLKIPKSSVTTKEFYPLPKEFLTQGGNNKKTGVLVRKTNSNGSENTSFQSIEMYYSQDETVFLDTDLFEEGTTIVRPDSHETYILNKTKELQGVFNINKGYAVFRHINILCESDEYYIIEEDSSYGLSNYDYIALEGSAVKENEVVAQ